MELKQLKLYSYRNLADATLHFSSGIHYFLGSNAQGKTNLLEAIALLALGRSFRGAEHDELPRWGTKEASVFGTISDARGETTLGVAIEKSRRRAFVNGSQLGSLAELFGHFLVVSFTPADLLLIRGQPEIRRRFIDKLAIDLSPGRINAFLEFHRVLRSKQEFLRADHSPDRTQLSVLNEMFAGSSAAVWRERARAVEMLRDSARSVHERLFGRAEELDLSLTTPQLGQLRGDETEDELKARFAEQLERSSQREMLQQRAVVGPHRDDLNVTLAGKSAKAFGSQGQVRSVVLSLKLAVLEMIERQRDEVPVVLLDDVDSELDVERRRALYGALLNKERQVFITATEDRLSTEHERGRSSVFEVRAGAVTEK